MGKVKVEKIVLKIGEKEIQLSIDEAKELKEILSGLFEKGEREKEYIYIPTFPPYIPPFSPYIYTYGDTTNRYSFDVTYSDNTLYCTNGAYRDVNGKNIKGGRVGLTTTG